MTLFDTLDAAGGACPPYSPRAPLADVTFTLPGNPPVKERARHGTSKNGKSYTYTPKNTVEAEAMIAAAYRAVTNRPPSEDAPFALWLVLCVETWRRRDIDNMVKVVLDGLNKVAYHDDSQVTDLHVKVRRGVGVGNSIVVVTLREADRTGWNPPKQAKRARA